MNDLGRKKLKTWLQKSLANHPENDNGLVAYVEAIVGDADGPDDDLREKWTEKLDDFLAESSADFTNVLLKGVRNGGNFGNVWKGGGGGGASAGSGVGRAEESNDAGTHDDMNDTSGEAPASRFEPEDAEGDADAQEEYQEDSWVDDGRGWEEEEEEQQQDEEDDENDEDDDDEGSGGRSRRSRRRAREEPEEEEATKTTAAAANSRGSAANKRARVQGGRGGDRGKNQNGGSVGGRGGRGGQQQGRGQQGRGNMANMAMQMQGGGRGPPQQMGMGSLAMGNQGMMMGPMPGRGMGPEQHQGGMGPGPGPWGRGVGDMNAGMPRGMPGGMMMMGPQMQGRGIGPGAEQWGGGMNAGMPRGMPRGMPGGMLSTPSASNEFVGSGGGDGRGPALLPEPRPPMGGANMGGRGPPNLPSSTGFVAPNGGGRGPMPRPQMGGGGHAAGGRGLPAPASSSGPMAPGGGGGPGPVPRPQMGGVNMGGRGGGLLGPGRPMGANAVVGAGGGGRGGGGQGMPLGGGVPSGGRGMGSLEGGRRDIIPMADRPAQGPQRSPVLGPVNGPRAFGPAAGEGNGAGMPRPGPQDGRPLGRMDGPPPRQEARQEFDNRPGVNMPRRPDAHGTSEMGRGPNAQPAPDLREQLSGRQRTPPDNPNANTSKGRSVFDRLGAPPPSTGGEQVQHPSARHGPDGQRQQQHPGEGGGMRHAGGVQQRPGMQQGSGMQQGPGMQSGPDARQGPGGMRRSPTNNQAGLQERSGQDMRRGPNFPEGAGMENTQGRRVGGQDAWSGVGSGGRPGPGAGDLQRPGMEQHAGAGRKSPQAMGPDLNRAGGGRGMPPVTNREHLGGEAGREGQRSGGRPEVPPGGLGRQMPRPDGSNAQHGWARQAGRAGPDSSHGQGQAQAQGQRQGQGQGQGHHPQALAQHAGARVPPQGVMARPGGGPMGQHSGNLHRGEAGRGMGSEFSRGDDGNGRPHQASERDGPGRGQPQPQPRSQPLSQQQQQQQQQQHHHHRGASSFQQQNSGAGRGAGQGRQPGGGAGRGGGAGGAPHTGGGSLAWGGFGVVKEEAPRTHGMGQGGRGFGGDRENVGSSSEPQPGFSQDRLSSQRRQQQRGSDGGVLRAEAPEWRGPDQPPRWAAPQQSAPRTTVRCRRVPADVGPVELSQHFAEFGKIVDMRLRAAGDGGKGEKEALIQFASSRQAQACVSSPKAVLGNRFIVVDLSETNLVDVDPHYQDPEETANTARAAATAKAEADAAAAAATAAAAARAARKKANDKLIAQASKTREVVAQQRVVVLLQEGVKAAAAPIATTKAKRNKVQGFLKMMQKKGKPETEQARYRGMLDALSAKVLVLEASSPAVELEAQQRKLADIEAEARAMGATVPPPPNPGVLARLEGGGRGSSGGRGRGRGAGVASAGGRGGGGEARVPRSLDNRPTTVKVSGLPDSAGEGDLRVHANMAGVVVAAAMLDRPGEGVVKFAERWAAEMFMSKSKSFGGIPLTMSWYTGPFPGSAPASSQPPRRPHQGQFGSAPTAGSFQQAAPVISDGAGDSIELKLAPVQQGVGMRGPRGGGGWGDDFGKEEGVGWEGDVWGKRKNNNGGSGNGSAGSSPLHLPSVEAGDDDDELYQDMAS